VHEIEFGLAKEAAVQAGNYLRSLNCAIVDSQEGKDIKLEADRKSEGILFAILQTTDIPILSEECGYVGMQKGGKRWIIDPLDGTANFWKGMRELSCVSVALWEDDVPILGVINRFQRKEVYSGVVGEGAWLNEEPLSVSGVAHINEAVLATGFPVWRNYEAESLSKFIKRVQGFKKIRMLGSAAIMGAFVAAGKIDTYIEEQIMLWDIAASSAIVKAAGGVAEIQLLENDQCICRLFANEELRRSYYADCV
jgi:myo-inositol-1(or 4)-monophosphatase